MDAFLAPADVVAAASKKRKAYTPDFMEKAVTEARQTGGQAAALKMNKGLPAAEHVRGNCAEMA